MSGPAGGVGGLAGVAGWLLSGLLGAPLALSEDLNLSADGWHTWRVDAVDEAPAWCCAVWRDGRVHQQVCDLDARDTGFSHMDDERYTPAPAQMQLYAQRRDGKIKRLLAYGPSCEVTSTDPIIDHGYIDSDTSLDWLEPELQAPRLREDATFAAIAIHAGVRAQRVLEQQSGAEQRLSRRKAAIFWMGQVRAAPSKDSLMALMFNDSDSAIRKHTAFSVSQSRLPDRGAALARLGRDDASDDVRGQAWFWLAQAQVTDAGATLLAELDRERSRHVRDQLVFALSQLPDAQGLEALIAVLENRGLSRQDRKRALFWMAQHEDDRAIDYLAALLKDR